MNNPACTCPYCNAPTECVKTTEIYPKDYGWMYLCRPCDSWVGCHGDSKRAFGRLANKELREHKRAAHTSLDAIWKTIRGITRSEVYSWLAKELEINKKECHIGMFDVETCKRTVIVCDKFMKDKGSVTQ